MRHLFWHMRRSTWFYLAACGTVLMKSSTLKAVTRLHPGCKDFHGFSSTDFLWPRQPGPLPSKGFWESRLVIKKSRFLARLGTCRTLEEARHFRDLVSDPKANHNCWAARSRGGETTHTWNTRPGMPMRAILEGANLFGAIVVVTRYFGGIKLGTGGLVRAYSAATRAELVDGLRLRILNIPASQVSALYRVVETTQTVMKEPSFAADGSAEAVVWVPQDLAAALQEELMGLGPKVQIQKLEDEPVEAADEAAALESEQTSEGYDSWDEQWKELLEEEPVLRPR
eukprot:g23945.t2